MEVHVVRLLGSVHWQAVQQLQQQDQDDDDDDDMVFVNTINLSEASLRSVYAVPSHMPAQRRLSISRRIMPRASLCPSFCLHLAC